MAHFQQLNFVKELGIALPDYFIKNKALEIGSWNVNGSVRQFFKDCDYLGVDIATGPGVDLVCKGEDLSFPDATFDTVVSCECFEHNPLWSNTFSNMVRMLKPGGLCIITCATLGRSEHGTKRTNADASLTALNDHDDYYANLKPSDFKRCMDLEQVFEKHYFFLNPYSKDLYFFGIKKNPGGDKDFHIPLTLFKRIQAIRKTRHVNLLSRLNYRIKFSMRYLFAAVLGEKTYHEIKFRLRHYISL